MPVVVLVDTNVWVSALITPDGHSARIMQAWIAGSFDVVVAPPLMQELAEVLARTRIRNKYNLSDAKVQRLLDLLRSNAHHVDPVAALSVCRDPDDNIVLETAILGGARYAVTRDDDLKGDSMLVAALQQRGVRVVSVRSFLELLGSGQM